MNRIVTAALLSLGALGLTSGQASAFFWKHCCNKCCTICVKPYNAFSPVAFGSVCFDGCNPIQSCPPYFGGPSCCPAPAGCDGCAPGHLPPSNPGPGAPHHPGPGAGAPGFQSPMPAPLPPGTGAGAMYPNWSYPPQYGQYGMVQPTGYRTAYYPNYYYGYGPMMPPGGYPMGNLPAYWNGGR